MRIRLQARLRGLDPVRPRRSGPLGACRPLPAATSGCASSRARWGHGDRGGGGVDPSRESELLPAGPPSPRPRRPSFLPLTPGHSGGCWAGTDKGLADWPRLIRSRADPGGNRRAGSSEPGPHGPAPWPATDRDRAVTPQCLTLPPPRHWSGPGPLRTRPSARLGVRYPDARRGETEAGGGEAAASSISWISPPALDRHLLPKCPR